MHLYHPQWQEVLETQCDDAGRERLKNPTPVEKFVCYRHFKPDFSGALTDPNEALGSILTEFCGPAWTGDKKAGEVADASIVDLPPSMMRISSRSLPHQERNAGDPLLTRLHTTESSQDFASFAAKLDVQLESLMVQYGAHGREYLRDYLFHNNTSRQLVVETLCTFASAQVSRLGPWDSLIPVATALLHTCSLWDLNALLAEISSHIGISSNTLIRAQEVLTNKLLHVDQIIIGDCVIEDIETEMTDEDAKEEDSDEESTQDRRTERARNREHLTNPRLQYVHDWANAHSFVASSSRNLEYPTYAEAYKKYKEQCIADNEEPFSFANFHGLMFRWAISPLYSDNHACPTCYLLFHSGNSVLQIEQDEHHLSNGHICDTYASEVEQIKNGTANFFMVVMDYSRIHELSRHTGPNESSILSVLNFTVVFNGGSRRQFDYFSKSKEGVNFMSRVMVAFGKELKHLLEREASSEIHFWSDGSLKTCGSIDNLLKLSNALHTPIIHTYFAPHHHGHSRCDAHFGRGQILLRKYYPNGGLCQIAQVMSAFKEIPETLTELLIAERDAEGTWNRWIEIADIPSWNQVKYENGVIHIARFGRGKVLGWIQVLPPEWHAAKEAHKNPIQ